MSADLTTFVRDFRSDRQILLRHLDKLKALDVTGESDEPTCAHVALTLHQTYTAIENILKRVADTFAEEHDGERWHRDLLDRMTCETELRPGVLAPDVADVLADLLAFRHYLIHGSVVAQPDGERLSALKTSVVAVEAALRDDLDRFEEFISGLLSQVESSDDPRDRER